MKINDEIVFFHSNGYEIGYFKGYTAQDVFGNDCRVKLITGNELGIIRKDSRYIKLYPTAHVNELANKFGYTKTFKDE